MPKIRSNKRPQTNGQKTISWSIWARVQKTSQVFPSHNYDEFLLIESSSPQELERLRAVIPAAPAAPSVEVRVCGGRWLGFVKGTLRESYGIIQNVREIIGDHNKTLRKSQGNLGKSRWKISWDLGISTAWTPPSLREWSFWWFWNHLFRGHGWKKRLLVFSFIFVAGPLRVVSVQHSNENSDFLDDSRLDEIMNLSEYTPVI